MRRTLIDNLFGVFLGSALVVGLAGLLVLNTAVGGIRLPEWAQPSSIGGNPFSALGGTARPHNRTSAPAILPSQSGSSGTGTRGGGGTAAFVGPTFGAGAPAVVLTVFRPTAPTTTTTPPTTAPPTTMPPTKKPPTTKPPTTKPPVTQPGSDDGSARRAAGRAARAAERRVSEARRVASAAHRAEQAAQRQAERDASRAAHNAHKQATAAAHEAEHHSSASAAKSNGDDSDEANSNSVHSVNDD